MRTLLRNMFLFFIITLLTGCRFLDTMENTITGNEDYDSKVTEVVFSETVLNVNLNESEYLMCSLTPSANQGKCHVTWEYDETMISVNTDNFGAVITGIKAGGTYIKAKCNGIVATCMISVLSDGTEEEKEPYIYSNYSVIELQPGNAATIVSSLYGGNVADMEFFEWTVKDSTIAEIAYSRNNCVVTAKKTGSTQIVCHHPDAKYDYSFVVYVYADKMTETYITTDYNVVTINKNEISSKTISVDLVNPVSAAYKNGFTWNYGDEESREIISVSANLNEAMITPLKNGIAKITVTHENSEYALDIIVRVNTIVKNTYIGLSTSSLIIEGSDTPYTVYASIENYDGYADLEKFTWDFPDNADNLIDWTVSGNSLSITGKKNGSLKIKVSHELSEYSRNLLVILQKQEGSAVDSSMYITTTQNYVQTQVGKEPTVINCTLVGGIEGEDNIGDDTTNFTWWIEGGENNGVIEVRNVTGSVKDLSSRSAASSGDFCMASLEINPVGQGTKKIVVTHPKCLYDTEITVKVYSETALVNPVTITTEESLIRLLNGNSTTVTAELRNANAGDENEIQWTSSDVSKVSLSPVTGKTTELSTFSGTGCGQTYVTAHLDGALADKKILVLTADTEDELNSMKGIYADSTYLRITSGETKEISVESFGLESGDIISWRTGDSGLCVVAADSASTNKCVARVTGISEGRTTVTAAVGTSEPVVFDVTVLKEGESSEIFDENAGYLTTSQNAVVLESSGESASLSVTGVNISPSDMALYTNWTMSDINAVEGEPVFDLSGSPGSNVTITANKPGKTNIVVKNKRAENTISINAKCGELYEWTDDYIIYITAEEDVVNMMNNQTVTIGCSLVNTTQQGLFSWKVIQGEDNIDITGLTSGTCNITGVNAGQAIIEVSNTLAGEITKEILVNVANTEEELKGFKYLTTDQNVITVGEQGNLSVSVSVMNAEGNVLSGFTWRSTNESVASVTGSGSVAVVYGKSIGTAKIIVENTDYCSYPLEIICNVVDPVAVAEDPYISCNNIVSCTVGSDYAVVSAELIGGTEADSQNFSWSVSDPSVAQIYFSNDTCQVKALKEGVTQIVITHPKASVPRTVLVICEPKITTNCYISLSETMIKMSPSDEPRTITATLVNGDEDDSYDFKWWADSYDRISMNYTGSTALVEPLSSGTVTLHVSHPKASSQKDIVLYISNYTDFAFENTYMELETGGSVFVNMEVPATGVDCVVSYKSDNNSVCTVFGNTSVCTLMPGDVPEGVTKTCTITATLMTKGGAKQAEAQMFVSVTGKDVTKPYIALYPDNLSTIITMNKDEKRNLSARLFGSGVNDSDAAGLVWEINNSNGEFIKFVGDKNYGETVQLEALKAGQTTITVKHNDKTKVKNPLTLYVIVTGIADPVVTLNYEDRTVYIGESTQTLMATVQNVQDNYTLRWQVTNDDEPDKEMDFFTYSESGNKFSISANKPGNATVTVILETSMTTSVAECKVHILEAEKIEFFVYDDETAYVYNENTGEITEDNRKKKYVNEFTVYPGQSKPLHWETVPVKDQIKEIYRSDSNYFEANSLGYVSSWTDAAEHKTYHYPENIGTLIISGKTNEGSAILKVTTASRSVTSLSVNNTYGYLFTTSKAIVSSTPKEAHDDPSILYIDYELRPACSKIYVTNENADKGGEHISLESGFSSYTQDQHQWVIDTHEVSEETAESGVVKGTLKFKIDGEVNCNIKLFARNENVVSSGAANQPRYEDFGGQYIKFQIYYAKHTFIPEITNLLPYYNGGPGDSVYGNEKFVAKYSSFDSQSNSFYLGDGEMIYGTVRVDEQKEPYSNVKIEKVEFVKNTGSAISDDSDQPKKQYELVNVKKQGSANSQNQADFTLGHERDYALVFFKKKNTVQLEHRTIMYKLKKGDVRAFEEVYNETVKETSFVGYLQLTYYSYAKNGSDSYRFPVYVKVRNCPCAEHSDYYITANTWNID